MGKNHASQYANFGSLQFTFILQRNFSAANGTSATKVKDNRVLPTKIRQTQLLVTYIFVLFLKKVIKGFVSVTECLDTLTLRLGFNLITDK